MSKQLIQKLESFRKKKGLSTLKLCKLMGIYPVTFRRWKKTGNVTEAYKRLIINFLAQYNPTATIESNTPSKSSDIAVIGIGCYYPGASNVQELWENILARRVQFRRMLDQRLPLNEYYSEDPKQTDKTYLTKAAFLENFQFDWGKLRIPKKTVESTDIAHWLALDTALKTFEDAGYKLSEIPLQNTGVIVGNTLTGEQTRSQTIRLRWPFFRKAFNATAVHRGMGVEERGRYEVDMEQIFKSAFYPVTEDSLSGGLANTIAGRICNYLNLKGGGYIVDGACSSSLLSVATAADALKMGNMDLALAGGVDISLDPFELVGFARAGALAKDQMRVYDQRAAGFLPGEGCGFVLLKRLNDALRDKNYIYAVIKGWGISSDGKGGIMEPSATGQSFAIGRAYKDLPYKISDVDFVEGHGTGTTKGDRVELEGIAIAIEKTISKGHKAIHSCGVTSFKSIVGHTKAAAGVGGLIKAILAVNQRVLPPTASCTEPNEVFQDKARLLYPIIQGGLLGVNKVARAGVSSAGFGGINCHITVESKDKPKEDLKPKIDERALFVSQQQTEVFVFSSRTAIHLKKVIQRFKEDLRNISIAEMADLAALLNKKSSRRLPIKVAIVADTPEHLFEGLVLLEQELDAIQLKEGQIHKIATKFPNTYIVLSNNVKTNRIGFLYPGQGSQRLNMTRVLVERYSWARDLLSISKLPLYDYIYKATDKFITKEDTQEFEKQLADTKITQPAIILSSLIWTEFLTKLGVEPECVTGHSLGELIAFYRAGAFNKETLIKFAELRGSLMVQKRSNNAGMAGLLCSKEKANELISKISGNIIVANINSPSQVVVSGGNKEIGKALELAVKEGISARRLNVSNAFHSSFMKEASNRIKTSKVLPKTFSLNSIGAYSCVEGALLKEKVDLNEYFSKQAISPVNFVGAVEAISKDCEVLIEVGPGRVLTDLAQAINKAQGPLCLAVESTPQSDRDINILLGELYVRNVPIKWEELYKNRLIKTFVPASRKKFIENQCEHSLKLGNEVLKGEPSRVLSPGPVVIEQPGEIIPGGLPSLEGKDNIANLLIDLTQKFTGFEKSTISLNLRFLDDLRLDSINVTNLIGQATRILGITGQLDPAKVLNDTLSQVRDKLDSLVQARGAGVGKESITDVLRRYKDKGWVRNFTQNLIPQEITTRNVNRLKSLKNVVFISDEGEDALVETIVKDLKRFKAKTKKIRYDDVEDKIKITHANCLVAILPKGQEFDELNKKSLKEIIKRFNKIIRLGNAKHFEKDATIVIVQFGGGNFGENSNLKDVASATAKSFASSLYLEIPTLNVRIIDFDNGISDKLISQKVVDELQTYERFEAVGYDSELKRKVICYENSDTSSYKKRDIQWSIKDVVLVTGGAKGITAQCSLEFARATGANMVLVGRSPAPKDKKDEANEINQTLKLFEKETLSASYYQCDVTDEKSVIDIIKEIQQKHGKITGFIHGAGLNSLKHLWDMSTNEAFNESLPKVMGAVNVCKALSGQPPKLIAAITSIIGVTGMQGSGWYGLSNEILNLYLHQFKAQNRKTQVVSIAYSIWDEIGMGAKLGSVEILAQKGIGAIPIAQGVKRFRNLIENDPGIQQVIVAARMAGIDTWKGQDLKTNNSRFIKQVEYAFPGVELIVQAHLNIEDDPYLLDHNWKGSLLLPFVFGLEAMTQTAQALLGATKIENIMVTNVQLNKPIIVDSGEGTKINIRSIKEEGGSKIYTQIFSELDNYKDPYFAAYIQFNVDEINSNKNQFKVDAENKTDVEPEEDLYGKILFQGKMFHCINKINTAHYDLKEKEGFCVIDLKNKNNTKYLIGSPFMVDSILQSMQLVFANIFSLPQSIETIFINPNKLSNSLVSFTKVKQTELDYLEGSNVSIINDEIAVSVEKCRLKILEVKQGSPDINEILNPAKRDSQIFENFIKELARFDNLILPKVYFAYIEDFDTKNKDQRRNFINVWLENLGYKGSQKINIDYSENNKPIALSINNKKLFVSISHKKNYVIMSLGNDIQGIDIEDVDDRSLEDWQNILKPASNAVLEQLLSIGTDLNIAGTCAWAIYESIYKATGQEEDVVTYEKINQGNFLFKSKILGDEKIIVCGVINLTRGKKKIVALIVGVQTIVNQNNDLQNKISFDSLQNLGFKIKDLCGVDADYKGPQDQLVFKCHFPVTFKHNQLLSKNVYFTNYFDFCGTLREYSIFPISKQFLDTARAGKTSMVTKMTSLDVYRPVQIGDILEGRLWMDGLKGDKNSTMNMFYEWYVINKDKPYKVADCRQDTIWIKLDHDGKAEIDEYPSYVNDFVNLMTPKTTRSKKVDLEGIKLFNYYSGKELEIFKPHLPNKYKVFEKTVTATLENSNLLSNIYFSSFAKWIGQLSDEYFYLSTPEFYKDYSGQKEIFCSNCTIDFFNESFPFDNIFIEMFINQIFENGLEVYFEFHKIENGKKVKILANAKQRILFATIINYEVVPLKTPSTFIKLMRDLKT